MVDSGRDDIDRPAVPRIECSKCGAEHHYDAASLIEQGMCRECSAFLRRPTEEEHQQFGDYLEWRTQRAKEKIEESDLT